MYLNYFGFLFFFILSLAYIWNGTDHFDKKEWRKFGLRFVLVFGCAVIIVFPTKWLFLKWPVVSIRTVANVWLLLTMSSILLFQTKLMIVLMCSIWGRINSFHKHYNQANYPLIASLFSKFGPGLLLFLKCMASLGSALELYGVWLSGSFLH